MVPVTCCVLREKDARHPVALDEVKCQRDAKVQAPSEYYHSKVDLMRYSLDDSHVEPSLAKEHQIFDSCAQYEY